MASISPEIRSLLKDVELNGTVTIPVKKLLWGVGWSQDRAGAWKDLLDIWVELGHPRDSLLVIAVADKTVLLHADKVHSERVPVSDWAKSN